MKIPCEVVVWQILPLVRRELARELVSVHGLSQADVAKRFGVTDAAISQYLTRKRGGEYSGSPFYPEFMGEVEAAARRIAEEDADCGAEMCHLCATVKRSGFLNEIYEETTGSSVPSCGGLGNL